MDAIRWMKSKPLAQSIKITPLVKKQGDRRLRLETHDLLDAMQKVDAVLSLLGIIDVVPACSGCQQKSSSEVGVDELLLSI